MAKYLFNFVLKTLPTDPKLRAHGETNRNKDEETKCNKIDIFVFNIFI